MDLSHIFPSANQYDALNALLAIIASNDEGMDITDWTSISRIVQMSLGRKSFPACYEFPVLHKDGQTVSVWVVGGHNHHKAADPHVNDTMTIFLKHVYSNARGTYIAVQFSAPQALYYAENGLEAGTYNFTWDDTIGSMVKGAYQFTLIKPVPAGGQITINTSSSTTPITSCKMSTYASIGDTAAIESNITIKEGSEGINLGTMQSNSTLAANLNCCNRVMWGSSNIAQSAVRQLLNSAAEAGKVWTPQTKFDRPPSWNNTLNGFMCDLPDDFLAAVKTAVIPCATNSFFEIDSLDGTAFAPNQAYTLNDKFFLLSRPEVYGTWDSSKYKDGEILEYFDGLSDVERVRYEVNGTARTTWSRTASQAQTYAVRNIYREDGRLYTNGAYGAYAIAPACIIG